MLLRLFVVFCILVIGILVLAVTRPSTVNIERSRIVAASPEKIFPLINDFHNWGRWAPQDREDPTMVRSYSGSAMGVSAVSKWTSSGSAGRGRMEITQSVPGALVTVRVDWVKPFAATNMNEFILENDATSSAAPSTKVIWKMQGTNVFVMKLMSVFMSLDRMMGKHFESGLDNLKAISEKQ
jgi:hypothetical protein